MSWIPISNTSIPIVDSSTGSFLRTLNDENEVKGDVRESLDVEEKAATKEIKTWGKGK